MRMERNFLLYLLPSVIKGAVGIALIIPITTYYLDPSDFGIEAILLMLTGFIEPLSCTGQTWALSAYYYKISEEDRKLLVSNLLGLDILLRIFWCAVYFMGAKVLLPLVVRDFDPRYLVYFDLLLVGVVLNGVWPTISYTLTLEKRAGTFAFLDLGQFAAGVTATIICLALFGLGTVTLFIRPVATGVFVTALGIFYIRRWLSFTPSLAWLRKIYRVGLPALPTNLVELISNTIDRYFIQRWIGLGRLGIYAHSLRYRQVFVMGSKAFVQVIVPEALRTFAERTKPETLRKTMKAWYGILGIFGAFVGLFSYEVVDFLTHGKFVAASPLVPLWFLLVFSHSFGTNYTQFLLFRRSTRFLAASGIAVNLAFIGVNAGLVYRFGIMGAVTAVLAGNLTVQFIRRWFAWKRGCPNMGDKDFWGMAGLVMGVYALNASLAPDWTMKLLLWCFLTGIIGFRSGLVEAGKRALDRWRTGRDALDG